MTDPQHRGGWTPEEVSEFVTSIHPDKTARRAVDACGGTYTPDQESSGYAQGHRDALDEACKAVGRVDALLDKLCGLLLTDADRRRATDLRDDPDSEDNERFASWYGGQLLALHDAVAALAKAKASPDKSGGA